MTVLNQPKSVNYELVLQENGTYTLFKQNLIRLTLYYLPLGKTIVVEGLDKDTVEQSMHRLIESLSPYELEGKQRANNS